MKYGNSINTLHYDLIDSIKSKNSKGIFMSTHLLKNIFGRRK